SGRYILKGVSGKDSFRSIEFARLFEDIKRGKVNTIVCTALDRISRSVRDFLNFFEILNKYDIEFVCLKQNYDTTTSQGKLFITIMMALAEFEREQTSERNKEATLARAKRGLWNGGFIIGYNLDPNKKGYIFVNEAEKALVNFAFKSYLKTGSVISTAKELNKHGYRTKEYTTRAGKYKPPKEFIYSSVKHMLTNYVYIGKKEVNKNKKGQDQNKLPERERYKLVDAVWEPIIEEEIFYNVQDLLKKNYNSKHNVAKAITHTYILNSGLLWCDCCGTEMEGRSGTGRGGIKYYYYRCKNNKCAFKVSAKEIEKVVIKLLKKMATNKEIAESIIKSANLKLQKELPELQNQKSMLQHELDEVKKFASGIMNKWKDMANQDTALFIKDKLDQLGKRRKEIEDGIESLDSMIAEIKLESINQDVVVPAFKKFKEIFDSLKPYQKKELIRLFLHKALLSREGIKIALYGQIPDIELSIYENQSYARSGMSKWLPGSTSERTTLWAKSGLKISRNHYNEINITDSIIDRSANYQTYQTILSA
ncbi:MAG: recombinase family protein, partial [Bacteroidales bacterium]|nr:recombinase family protein [Bacteroidales bacterium]